jgi:hypothetical protein
MPIAGQRSRVASALEGSRKFKSTLRLGLSPDGEAKTGTRIAYPPVTRARAAACGHAYGPVPRRRGSHVGTRRPHGCCLVISRRGHVDTTPCSVLP